MAIFLEAKYDWGPWGGGGLVCLCRLLGRSRSFTTKKQAVRIRVINDGAFCLKKFAEHGTLEILTKVAFLT